MTMRYAEAPPTDHRPCRPRQLLAPGWQRASDDHPRWRAHRRAIRGRRRARPLGPVTLAMFFALIDVYDKEYV
jgi:hypothetical protein